MHYQVTARWWNDELRNRFGDEHGTFFLTDEEVIKCIIEFGRAAITEVEGIRRLDFQNDYD